MKSVFCTMGGSLNNVCHIMTVKTSYPPNWKPDPRQEECDSIEAIKRYIEERKAEFVMFGIRSNGIPNRAVNVNDTEKLEKALRKFERIVKS